MKDRPQKPTRRTKGNFSPRSKKQNPEEDLIRLNKYIANAGICSRREADKLISAGIVSVNGKVISELGYKVKPDDDVRYNGQRLRAEKKFYIIMNKPKDTITTVDDPHATKTVMHIIKGCCKERLYPVGRLDRNTTGILLLTNDGKLTKRLTHPSSGIEKIYTATLNKNIKSSDFKKFIEGVELDDGMSTFDAISLVTADKKNQVIIQLHSGRNRIIRRTFEALGYKVNNLDRIKFAGLTKKGIKRGEWRFLTDKEVSFLKML